MVELPEEYWVYDFTKGYPKWDCPYDYQIGRYDETRPGMYATELFEGGESTTSELTLVLLWELQSDNR